MEFTFEFPDTWTQRSRHKVQDRYRNLYATRCIDSTQYRRKLIIHGDTEIIYLDTDHFTNIAEKSMMTTVYEPSLRSPT